MSRYVQTSVTGELCNTLTTKADLRLLPLTGVENSPSVVVVTTTLDDVEDVLPRMENPCKVLPVVKTPSQFWMNVPHISERLSACSIQSVQCEMEALDN